MGLRTTPQLVLGTLLGAILGFSIQASADSKVSPKANYAAEASNTFWIIPHTHWEGAVFKTREEYLEIGLPHILKALDLLKTHPEYRFVLDQVAYVKPFLERYPEEEAAFRRFVSEGKLEIVGGTDVMLDVNMPSGESWVRQVLYGKGYFRKKLGVNVTVGWGLDTFGHHAQMPQLLKLAGYKSYWFQRGVREHDTPSEFLWQGIDGSKIPAFWLPLSYGMFYPTPGSQFEFDSYARREWEALGHYSRWPDRVAMAGADVSEPEESLPLMAREFNRERKEPFTLRFGIPADFEAVVVKRPDRPVVTGELNPVFQGVYSARIEVKQWIRNLERILTNAEQLSALSDWLGLPTEKEELARAWEPMLFNQAHDLASGTMVNKVYKDTIRGYEFSKSLGEERVETGLDAIASRIDTRGDGTPVIVFNTLGWPRTDIADADIGFSEPGTTAVELMDPAGRVVPIQFLEAQRYADGGIKHAKIAFIAREVPALGYSVFRIVRRPAAWSPGQTVTGGSGRSSSTHHEDSGFIENDYYRATFDLWTGEMTSLRLKSGDWEALDGQFGNVVAREQDGGDFWELYGTLNGGRLTAMTRKQGPPASERARFSNQWVGGNGATKAGPVFSQFQIAHPFGDGSFSTTVRLYPGVHRIDIRTEILNNDKFVRYRVLFPTSIKNGRRFDEIPFGAIERPEAQEFPAQNWIDYGNGARGIALLNRGLPGNNIAGGTLLLSLMRSASITAYPFFGGYEPGVSSDLGLELGKRLAFDYALVPHEGDWRAAEVYRAGWEFNNPLVVRKATAHAGSLPKRWGLLEVSQSNVIVSTLKPGEDGSVILRVYEAAGRATKGVSVRLHAPIASAHDANLMEDSGGELGTENDTLRFGLGPYEIRTFKLRLRSPQARP